MSNHRDDLVVTGLGVITQGTPAETVGLQAHQSRLEAAETPAPEGPEAYSLRGFNAAPRLLDRKLLKAVSAADAIGLVGISELARSMRLEPGSCSPYAKERIGLYVGAPPASADDNVPYAEAMQASRNLAEFGRAAMSARPTTLLIGLPNNVLCYGSLLLSAMGPNSNYTGSSLSGQTALINAAKRLRRGHLDLAVAGGFSAHNEPVNSNMYAQLGLVRMVEGDEHGYATEPYAERGGGRSGMVLADGSVFVSLERRAAAARRGAAFLGVYAGGALASDGLGPLRMDPTGLGFERAVRLALGQAGAEPTQVGLILANASGIAAVDAVELAALERLFPGRQAAARPALGFTSRRLGHLSEAGGLLEVGLAGWLHERGELPAGMVKEELGYGREIDANRPYTLILRASPWGEYGCLVMKREMPH